MSLCWLLQISYKHVFSTKSHYLQHVQLAVSTQARVSLIQDSNIFTDLRIDQYLRSPILAKNSLAAGQASSIYKTFNALYTADSPQLRHIFTLSWV